MTNIMLILLIRLLPRQFQRNYTLIQNPFKKLFERVLYFSSEKRLFLYSDLAPCIQDEEYKQTDYSSYN